MSVEKVVQTLHKDVTLVHSLVCSCVYMLLYHTDSDTDTNADADADAKLKRVLWFSLNKSHYNHNLEHSIMVTIKTRFYKQS